MNITQKLSTIISFAFLAIGVIGIILFGVSICSKEGSLEIVLCSLAFIAVGLLLDFVVSLSRQLELVSKKIDAIHSQINK